MDLDENKENVDSGDIFDKYIVFDPDISLEILEDSNENEAQTQAKAKKEHFNLINDAMNEHDEESMSDDDRNKVWEDLSGRLNAVGPPTYTTAQWKKKWIAHKYNVNFRKRKSITSVVAIPQKFIRLDQSCSSSHSISTGVDVPSVLDSTTDQLLQTVIENQGIIIEKLETSNSLLRELVNLRDEK